MEPDREVDDLAHAVIGAAIDVHRALGPGFLEQAYEEALCVELNLRNIPYCRQVSVPVVYKGHKVDDHRLDLLVAGRLVVEIKAVEKVLPVHEAQVLSYLKATRCSLGLVINFNVPLLRDGLRRVVLCPP